MKANDFQKLAKQIEKIESSDENFMKNPKWQYLRAKQDHAYINLAESRIAYHQSVLERYKNEQGERFKRQCDRSREQIRFCTEFLKLFAPESIKVIYGEGRDEHTSEPTRNTSL